MRGSIPARMLGTVAPTNHSPPASSGRLAPPAQGVSLSLGHPEASARGQLPPFSRSLPKALRPPGLWALRASFRGSP